jgi:hypothetical protein
MFDMQNVMYQFLHPWHWLTYGQNAAAVEAVTACLGLIGLFIYTFYTRRMMRLSQDMQRASITPVLILRGGIGFVPTDIEYSSASELSFTLPELKEYRADLDIKNIGEGAAIFLKSWSQPASEGFDANDMSILIKTSAANEGNQELTELLKSESTNVSFPGFKNPDLQQRWLFVIDSIDHSNGRHQLRILRSENEISVSMVHGRGDSLGERVEAIANRCVEILNAVKRASTRIGS